MNWIIDWHLGFFTLHGPWTGGVRGEVNRVDGVADRIGQDFAEKTEELKVSPLMLLGMGFLLVLPT